MLLSPDLVPASSCIAATCPHNISNQTFFFLFGPFNFSSSFSLHYLCSPLPICMLSMQKENRAREQTSSSCTCYTDCACFAFCLALKAQSYRIVNNCNYNNYISGKDHIIHGISREKKTWTNLCSVRGK